MFFSPRKKTDLPGPGEALPGRATAMPVPGRHLVLGTPLQPPFPPGHARAMFGLGCFWGAERKFWQQEGVFTTAVGYAAGITPNPTYEEVCSGMTGHNEVVLVVYDPARIGYDALLRLFWESHDPTQGMRQGNDVGTQYRSGIYCFAGTDRRRHGRPPGLCRSTGPSRLRPDHDRDPGGPGILLRRGLSPAISRPQPERLLRAGRHRRRLSRRRRRRCLNLPVQRGCDATSFSQRAISRVRSAEAPYFAKS
jgi:peptide-methionine (S)-S-oxide reductase